MNRKSNVPALVGVRRPLSVAVAAALGMFYAGGAIAEESEVKLKEVAVSVEVDKPVPINSPAATEGVTARTLSTVTVMSTVPGEKMSIDVPSSTGSRLGLTPRETPASVTIVDRDTIEQRGSTDTQEILKSVPGVTAASPPGSSGSVFYRGFGASSLTQLFNGITVQYDAIAARPVDSWIYDRVEVIGGPSTFLFGAGAVGGSINYITKLASRDEGDSTQARVSYGSYDTSQLSIGANRRLGSGDGVKNYLRADVNRADSNGYVDGNTREAWTSAFSLLTDITPQLSHTLAIEYQKETVDRPYWGTPLLNPTTGDGRINPDTRFKNYNSADGIYEQTINWQRSLLDYRISDATSIRNTLYHYDALRDYRNVEVYKYNPTNTAVIRSAAYLTRHDQELTGDRVELTHKSQLAGRQSDWATGFDYSVNKQTRFPRSVSGMVSTVDPISFTTESFFDIPGMVPGFDPDRSNTVTTLALFLENRTRLSNALSLVSGLRHDQIDLEVTNHRTVTATNPAYFKQTYSPTTGRVGLVYDITPAANVYVQYSTAADPPAGILTTASFSQVRDFDLTTGKQIEAGSKFDFLEGRGVATVAAYSITRKNIAITDPNNPGTTIPVGQQSSRGIELAASLKVTRNLMAQGNFSYVDAQYDDFTQNVGGVVVSRAGNTPTNIPARVANLWLTYNFTPELQAGVDARYVSSRFGDTANTISDSAYALYGAFTSYRLQKNTSLTARVRNLTDEIYAASVTGSPMFYLGAPRTYELALQTHF
ncbi:MAG: TonB-dependent receptor [Thiobacillus sp.]|nr:TonB-dependent receptor [Thiobacillus sp.]MDP2977267.1 TonB-dependent receptor [Thiobacillus sp.]